MPPPRRPLPAIARASLPVLLLLAAGLLVYWPGLSGGYVFDDFGNLVDNPAFAPAALHAHFWHSVWSTHSGPFDRPLSMLSFATQAWFTGLAPWPLKLGNVLIHLCNGWLVWLLSRRVLGWLEAGLPAGRRWLVGAETQALLVAAAWLLAPIQLTAVLYVIQRMESLAATFVLLGLLAYWHGRMRLIRGRPHAWGWIWGGLLAGTVLAVLAKETGVMLPAYAFVLEWLVLRGRLATPEAPPSPTPRGGGGREGEGTVMQPFPTPALPAGGEGVVGASGARRAGINPLVPVFLVVLVIPGVLGLAWLLPGVLSGAAYAARPFTLAQRLLTEGRVMVDYLHWTVLPSPNALSLYHDDIRVSTGWLQPWTTAASWALIAGLLGAALGLRRRAPLFALGVLWFFAGQSLLSTFVPLELVYEHRNYLPSWGVFIALFGLLFAWSPADAERRRTLRLLTVGGLAALVALYGVFTAIRAQIWGNPYRLAYFEATTHPKSPRASYDLGRMMFIMAKGPDSALSQLGMRQMEQGALLPGADLQPLQALVFMAAKNGLPVRSRWWTEMRHTIATTPMSAEDVGALYSLIHCGIDGVCRYTPADLRQLGGVLAFAVQRNPRRADLVTLQANFAANIAHDNPLAYQLMQRAVALSPGTYAYWKNLVVMQTAAGLFADARNVLERMRELDRFGIHRAEIDRLGRELAQKETETQMQGEAPPPNLSQGLGEEHEIPSPPVGRVGVGRVQP